MTSPQFPGSPEGYPPGYGFPTPPPKKSRAEVLAASLVTALALGGGGFYAYSHFLGSDSGSSSDSSVESSVMREAPASVAPAQSEVATGMFSAAQTEYLERLQESGISSHSPTLAVKDGQDACTLLSRGGSFAEAVQLMLQKNNSGINESGAMFASVTAVQTLCPQSSPFGASSGTPLQPTPPGQDGEYIRRLQAVGLSVDNYDDAIADGRGVCAAMSVSPSPEKFLNAAKAVSDANPRSNRTAAVFLSVTAMQVYCPPR